MALSTKGRLAGTWLSSEFAALFEESLSRQEIRAGEVITAEVVRIDLDYVVVNAGLKSESLIPIEEFKNDRGEVEVRPGEFIQVAIEMLEDGYGEARLSRDRAKRIAAWNDLDKALNDGILVKGVITGKVKGGLTVMTNGIRAFLPDSLVDTRPIKDTTPFEGKEFEFKVVKLDRKRNNVVLSRRAVLEANMGEERQKLLENLQEGTVVKGIVKNITDYGAFVDLGGIDGLLHITDLAWRRVRHPSEVLNVGDEVTAKVLKFDQEKNRVSLGMKQCRANPWDDFAMNHKKGDKVRGAIKSITDFGIFIGLPGGIDGLVHLSDLSWSQAGEEAEQNYKKGDEIEALVLSIDVEKEKISLRVLTASPSKDASSTVRSETLKEQMLGCLLIRSRAVASDDDLELWLKRGCCSDVFDVVSRGRFVELVIPSGLNSDDLCREFERVFNCVLHLPLLINPVHERLPTIAPIAIFPSGATMSVGRVANIMDGGISVLIDDAWDLLDPGTKVDSEFATDLSSMALIVAVRY